METPNPEPDGPTHHGPPESMVHLRCGDDLFDALDEAGLPGLRVAWMEPLCEGPTPDSASAQAFREQRVAWAAPRFGLDAIALTTALAAQDHALDEAVSEAVARNGEVVLWFEHTLFDQIVLIHLLARLWPQAAGRLSLICIHRHPAIRRFIGLGQLAPSHLAALFVTRRRITTAQGALAGRAWRAFTAPTPEPLENLMAEADFAPLPLLSAALDRHRRQYPWCRDGLALTETLILRAVDGGADRDETIFYALHALETAPWQSRPMVAAWLNDLITATDPPLLVRSRATADGRLALTAAGRAVLAGQARVGRRNRWLGGVHLTPDGPDWCWNGRQLQGPNTGASTIP